MITQKFGLLLKFSITLFLIQPFILAGCGSESLPSPEETANKPVTTEEEITAPLESSPDQNIQVNEKQKQTPEPEEEPSSSTPVPIEKLSKANRIDKKDRIWIENVPYDVWFDSPLDVLGDPSLLTLNRKEVKPVSVVTKNNHDSSAKPPSKESKTSSVASHNPLWEKLITADIIQDEVKAIRNRLNGSFRSVGQFNKSLDQIGTDCSTLAGLGYLVEKGDYVVSWKKSALKIIQLSVKISENSSSPGRQYFKSGKVFFDQLSTILSGNQSVAVEIPNKEIILSDVAERSTLMQRMEQINNFMDSEISSQKKFDSQRDQIMKESALLAVLSNLILHESFESADEEDYQDAGSNMLKEALELSNSASEENFSKWNEYKDRIRKRCDQCHEDYRL